MRGIGHSYKLVNQDRIYRTQARTPPAVDDVFDIDIIVHTGELYLVGATVVVSTQIYEIARGYTAPPKQPKQQVALSPELIEEEFRAEGIHVRLDRDDVLFFV